jgi:hypothetical protein
MMMVASHIILTATSSLLELKTTMEAPNTAKRTPTRPCKRNFSLRMSGAITTFDIKVVVPNGAIVDAGANPYAKPQQCYVHGIFCLLFKLETLTNEVTQFAKYH